MLQSMLEAGVHFGHQSRRWNPKMAPYIYEEKNGIHILDVVQTIGELEKARTAFKSAKNVIFVGTRPAIAPLIEQVATKTGSNYVNTRWVGGLLTNWTTMTMCLEKLGRLDAQLETATPKKGFTKKDILSLTRERERLEKFFGGLRNLKTLPDLVVIVGQPNEPNDDSARSVAFILDQLTKD
ncbi:30S ribosomal protein S2, chloroplastic [Ostreococcus tauri]|uniref:30S ribosomal protein S2, chloroplastic n=1 Tax=Ostreococcus tauri TaxID=70448 RepID=A0A1Y5I4G3_OSTTA|nr:30S ribosomal protein S2, chloroplastic [Ostreococcus tauri]